MQKITQISLQALLLAGIFMFLVPQAIAQSPNDQEVGSEPVYRFYNDGTNSHFYTISQEEKDFIIANDQNWNFEGQAYSAFDESGENTSPLYRFYSSVYGGHFYTISQEEKDFIIANDQNWNFEGVAYYVGVSGSPVYRFYSINYQGHFYTTSKQEKDFLLANDPNWIFEGIAYYSGAPVVEKEDEEEDEEDDKDDFNPSRIPQCADGLDNNSDGLIDLLDPNCDDAEDLFEQDFSTAPASVESYIHIRARGQSGGENINLLLNGDVVASWTLFEEYSLLTYKPENVVEIDELIVQFDNDAENFNADVDYVRIGEDIYQTEDPLTYSEGSWSFPDGCTPGNKEAFRLHCNGFFRYDEIPQGTIVGAVPEEGYCHDTEPIGDGFGFNTTTNEVCFLTAQAAEYALEDETNFCQDTGVLGDGIGTNAATSAQCFLAVKEVPSSTLTPLSTPQGLQVVSANNDAIEISWSHPTETDFMIMRNGEFLTMVSDQFTYLDDAVEPNLVYDYHIKAYDGQQFSPNADRVLVSSAVKDDTAPPLTKDTIPAAIRDDYTIAFYDEFEGTALDIDKWDTSFIWGPDLIINNEVQYYVDIETKDVGSDFEVFDVSDGSLTISMNPVPEQEQLYTNNQEYTSGIITSRSAFNFTHGYAEARVKVANGRGTWPAFWLLNTQYVDLEPEIDIMEHHGRDLDRAYQTYHYFDETDTLVSQESQVDGPDYSADFHIFSVEWEPGLIQFYVDGVAHNTITGENISEQDMYILANLAAGGSWAGYPDETTTYPQTYEIDWIRVYQKPVVE